MAYPRSSTSRLRVGTDPNQKSTTSEISSTNGQRKWTRIALHPMWIQWSIGISNNLCMFLSCPSCCLILWISSHFRLSEPGKLNLMKTTFVSPYPASINSHMFIPSPQRQKIIYQRHSCDGSSLPLFPIHCGFEWQRKISMLERKRNVIQSRLTNINLIDSFSLQFSNRAHQKYAREWHQQIFDQTTATSKINASFFSLLSYRKWPVSRRFRQRRVFDSDVWR